MRKQFFLFIFIYLTNFVFAQIITDKKEPRSFSALNLVETDRIESYQLPFIDAQNLIEEDATQPKENGNRIAFPVETNLNLENSGTWESLPNGDRVWRLNIYGYQAKSLSIDYNSFNLPIGGELFVYSIDKRDVRGAYTHKNNRENEKFVTYLIKGNSCIIEYYEPKIQKGKGRFTINRIYYGYKGPSVFGDAGACNNNINCPEGMDWQTEKKSQALSIFGNITGLRNCSGAMVNNTREDGTPYYLTARHCLSGTEDNWTFLFNYESLSCANIDGNLSDWVFGSTVIATDEPSDFALLLLDEAPPPSYDVYHSGWDANDSIKDSVVCIHHPKGDIKKISFDYDSISTGIYGNAPPSSHWQVADWDDGTTEPSSSGSPLFDKNHHIIGQLHGGTASCISNTADFYGKFSYSWNTGNTPSTRLDYWLDPDSIGISVLNGNSFNTINDSLDVALVNIIGLKNEYCNANVNDLSFMFRNIGSDTIFMASFKIFMNDSLIDSLVWNDTLVSQQHEFVNINSFSSYDSLNEIKIVLDSVNNVVDSNQLNDTISKKFVVTAGNSFMATFMTDFWGNETSYFLIDSNNDTIASKDGFPSSSSTTEESCVMDGCYTFVLKDEAHDGLDSPGGITLSLNGSDFKFISGANFNMPDSMIVVDFCFCKGCTYLNYTEIDCDTIKCSSPPPKSIDESEELQNLGIYPNPNKGQFSINSEIDNIKIYDVMGRIVTDFSETYLDNRTDVHLLEQRKGMFFLEIQIGRNRYLRKVIIE